MEINTVKSDVGMSWEKVKLGEVFTQIKNGASIKQTDGLSGIPITRIETISNSFLDYDKLGYADINDESFKEFYLEEGDILMSHINSWLHLGKTAIVQDLNRKVIHGMNLLLLKANRDLLFPKYSKYFFETEIFKQQLNKISNQSVNQSSFSVTKLRNLQIPLPPLPIQKRIAEILDAADALKRKDQQLLQKYDELAQAIFIDMFGNPVKNDKGWEVKTIKSSTNILTYGLTVRPQYIEEGIPLISARELRNGFVNYEGAPKISNADFKKLSNKCKPQKGDILFSKTGSIGLSAIVDGSIDFAVTQNAARINFKKEYYEIYFIYSLLRQEAFINKCVTLVKGNAVKDLQLGDFSEIEIICPPINLQRQFSEVSMLSNHLIKTSDNNSKASDNLFQTLIQKAFKGELVSE